VREGGALRHTGPRPYIADLDQLPLPAWDLLEGFPRKFSPPAFKTCKLPAASLVTSRGCPNQCIFCDRSVFGASCHGYSADYVIQMILELYHRYGVREIAFEDDTFITFKQRLVEICQRLIELKLDLSWSCLGRVNHVTAENLALMKQAGCWQISFGVESGSQEILKTIRKNVTLEQIRRALALCKKAGILSKGFFIVGHPGETPETLRATIDFALELPLNDISVNMLTPFPGTELYDRAAEFGRFDPDWSKMNMLNTVFVPHGLREEDLVNAQKELLRRFYLRPRVVINYIGRLIKNPTLFGSLLRGFIAFLRSI
jgi:anaerobic magnesium-protoporphyrin IX monomethyl ester cyclase